MLNHIDNYTDAGTKAAKAVNVSDGANAKFHRDWCARAIRLESDDDKLAARQAYDAAYRAARIIK